VRLDKKFDFAEVKAILLDAYRCVGPAKLAAQLPHG
jgi:hypothetical protein